MNDRVKVTINLTLPNGVEVRNLTPEQAADIRDALDRVADIGRLPAPIPYPVPVYPLRWVDPWWAYPCGVATSGTSDTTLIWTDSKIATAELLYKQG